MYRYIADKDNKRGLAKAKATELFSQCAGDLIIAVHTFDLKLGMLYLTLHVFILQLKKGSMDISSLLACNGRIKRVEIQLLIL